jgi:hypothetical protein
MPIKTSTGADGGDLEHPRASAGNMSAAARLERIKPLPLKVYTIPDNGAGLTPEEAIDRTRELVARANEAALRNLGSPADFVLRARPPRNPMTDSDRVRFLFDHGRLPAPCEEAGWY